MGLCSSGGSAPSQTQSVRYAPYLEDHHKAYLDYAAEYVEAELADGTTPYEDIADIVYEAPFFGSGYSVSSFPSLYDMFGKFVAGLDVDTLFTQILDESINNTAIDDRVSAYATDLGDDIEENAFPRFATGMRDINSVISSSFVVGKAMLESRRVKEITKYDAELRSKMLIIAHQRWDSHLTWNKEVPRDYAELMKFYFLTKIDADKHNIEMEAQDRLWAFRVLTYYRDAVSAMTGAGSTTTSQETGSGSAIGGALTGAAAGAMVGGVPGAIIGGALGLLSGIF